ncbi:MAG: arginine deiminase-related protein [Sediminibacterium sp.]|nr:arginine deiminase-related protein [Sediminibacterium sp.]
MQHSAHLLMIQPVRFEFNTETAVNNSFQTASADAGNIVQQKAQAEFDAFIALLQSNDIDVTVVKDTPVPHTPDSVFPNNWISFHEPGSICLYPMFAPNRRLERKQHVLDVLSEKFRIEEQINFTAHEAENHFLEGTGSMVLDREHRIAYACLSPRTNLRVLEDFCNRMGYQAITFHSVDGNHQPIYHTNVMMCVADSYVVICLESIPDQAERSMVKASLEKTGKTIIEISTNQMNHFAGNMLQVHNRKGEKFLVMSSQAYHSLTPQQILTIEQYNPIIHSDITTIETNGGGSARCMMAEIFLELK